MTGWRAAVLAIFGSHAHVPTSPATNDLAYWTTKLQEAERELEATTKRSDINAAARRLMRVKASLSG